MLWMAPILVVLLFRVPTGPCMEGRSQVEPTVEARSSGSPRTALPFRCCKALVDRAMWERALRELFRGLMGRYTARCNPAQGADGSIGSILTVPTTKFFMYFPSPLTRSEIYLPSITVLPPAL